MFEIIQKIDWFVYPLGILGILGCLFFVERFVFLHKGQIRPEGFLQGLKNLWLKGRKIEALTLCEETPGAVARLMKIALVNSDEPVQVLENILQKNALLELPLLRKRIESLRVMGQFAPLIGLIGTVFFLLKGFWTLGSLQAYTHLTSFSPYIISALSVTFIGLVEMFLFYAAYHFLMGRVRALIFDMEWAVSDMLLFLKAQVHDKNEAD